MLRINNIVQPLTGDDVIPAHCLPAALLRSPDRRRGAEAHRDRTIPAGR